MKERPILFSAPMVRALLAGTKTQTRRVCKGARVLSCERDWPLDTCPYGKHGDRLWVKETIRKTGEFPHEIFGSYCTSEYVADGVQTRADAWPWKLRTLSAMFCPRGLSRITLEITDVRVQRLMDMEGQGPYPGESDALAEGINRIHHGDGDYYYSAFRDEPHPGNWGDPTDAFRELWESINGAGSWDANPWVWALTFRKIEGAPQ